MDLNRADLSIATLNWILSLEFQILALLSYFKGWFCQFMSIIGLLSWRRLIGGRPARYPRPLLGPGADRRIAKPVQAAPNLRPREAVGEEGRLVKQDPQHSISDLARAVRLTKHVSQRTLQKKIGYKPIKTPQ